MQREFQRVEKHGKRLKMMRKREKETRKIMGILKKMQREFQRVMKRGK
jgi:hypothetical protein